MGRPQTIDAYLEGFSGQARDLLEQLCALAHEAVPEASEAIKWGSPAGVGEGTRTAECLVDAADFGHHRSEHDG